MSNLFMDTNAANQRALGGAMVGSAVGGYVMYHGTHAVGNIAEEAIKSSMKDATLPLIFGVLLLMGVSVFGLWPHVFGSSSRDSMSTVAGYLLAYSMAWGLFFIANNMMEMEKRYGAVFRKGYFMLWGVTTGVSLYLIHLIFTHVSAGDVVATAYAKYFLGLVAGIGLPALVYRLQRNAKAKRVMPGVNMKALKADIRKHTTSIFPLRIFVAVVLIPVGLIALKVAFN